MNTNKPFGTWNVFTDVTEDYDFLNKTERAIVWAMAAHVENANVDYLCQFVREWSFNLNSVWRRMIQEAVKDYDRWV